MSTPGASSAPEPAPLVVPANSTVFQAADEADEASKCPIVPRPLWFVGLLTVLSAPALGIYFLVWLGVTWAQLKRLLKDKEMHPFWHALTPFVPIYGLVCIFRHFTKIDATAEDSGSKVRVYSGWCLAAVVAGNTLIRAADRMDTFAAVPATYFGGMLVAAAVVHGQYAVNAIARAVAVRPIPQRPHWAEWLLAVLLSMFSGLVMLGYGEPTGLGLLVAGPILVGVACFLSFLRAPLLPDFEARERRSLIRGSSVVTAMSEKTRAPVSVTGYRIVVTSISGGTDAVIASLRSLDETLTEAQAKAITATLPFEVASGLTLKQATEVQTILRGAGATAEVR